MKEYKPLSSIARINIWLALAGIAALTAFAWWTAIRVDMQMRIEILQQARLAAPAVDAEFVALWSGTPADAALPSFKIIRERLATARAVNPRCRFLYLLGRRPDGNVFFYLDTEAENSSDYSPPGQIYTEVSSKIQAMFSDGRAITDGPYPDRWGTWVSALVPLFHPETGRVVAVLGMDVDVENWKFEVVRRSALPVGLAAFIFSLGVFIMVLMKNRSIIHEQDRKIRESEERYSAFINSTADMAFLKDAQFRYSFINRPLADFFGKNAIGLTDYDLMQQDAADACRLSDQQAIGSDTITVNEEIVGGRIFETTKFPVLIGGKKVVGGLIRDITDRMQAIEEKRKLSVAVEQSSSHVMITNMSGEIEYINAKFTEVTGYTAEEVIGKSPRILKSGAHDADFYRRLWETLLSGREWHGEFRNRKKDGSLFWDYSSISPVKNEKGDITHFIAVNEDITQRKMMEEALAMALEEKAAHFREFQHRVKNSLAMITSIAELEAIRSGEAGVKKALLSLGGRIHTLSELYSMLFESEGSHRVQLDRYCISIGDFIMEAHTVRDGRIALSYRMDPVVIDARRASSVGLILNELITNALKYAFPEGRPGTIGVILKEENGRFVLGVEDDGVPLPEGFNLEQHNGLGIELVKMLAKQLNGSVEYRSGDNKIFMVRWRRESLRN